MKTKRSKVTEKKQAKLSPFVPFWREAWKKKKTKCSGWNRKCRADTNPTLVVLVPGEHPAAMQHGNTAAGSPTSKTVLVMLAFFLGQLR